jgi:tetratricopeptide (TPR) repeat protein
MDITHALERLVQGQSKPAQTILEKLARQAAANGRLTEAAILHRHRGSVALLADLRLAIGAYREATELDPKSWRNWNLLAHLLRHADQLREAELAYRQVLTLSHAAKDAGLVALAYEHLGAVLQADRHAEEAKAVYRKALSIHGTRDDQAGLARIYCRLGDLYAGKGIFNEAQAIFRDALAIHQTLGDRSGVAVDYANLGGVYIAQRSFKQGNDMYHEALKINKSLDRKASIPLCQDSCRLLICPGYQVVRSPWGD